ncbi:hypothetical protein FP744_10007983 [Trichoderma asperellum]
MSTRCRYCSGLSVEKLLNLTKDEFSGHEFPTSAYYQHHNSFHDLEQSANDGCDLCLLILDCFKGIEWTEGDYQFPLYAWETATELNIEDTAYTAAKELAVSDVKLSLSTDHVYLGDPLGKVECFNTLLVQVGPRELPDESDSNSFPFLTLSLNNQGNYLQKSIPLCYHLMNAECMMDIEGTKIGRLKVDSDLASHSQFEIARQWLDECQTTHLACLVNKVPELPTRVVDIGPPDAAFAPRVHISHGAQANYIALSHCWGGRIETILTTKTYHDYQKELPISDIAHNFKDAFRIAKGLGIRYVWIDSLCIIQDSREDWEAESIKMGAIYRNATLTISALVAAKSTVGILKNNENRFSKAPKTAQLRIYDAKLKAEEIEVEWKSREEENLRNLMLQSALMSRGWTLQEYVLSPRNLLYGRRQIYWRCPSRVASADNTPMGNQFPDKQFQNAAQVIYSDILAKPPQMKADVKAILADYYELVETYSARQLTYGSDKFAAFAGIAQMIHPAIGGQYLAGNWTADFKHGLLWYAEMSSCRHVESHGAPSWSWMVTDASILFSTIRIFETTPYDAKLTRIEGISQDLKRQFSQAKSASIILEGLTMPLIRSEQNIRSNEDYELLVGTAHYDEPSPSDDWKTHSIYEVHDDIFGHTLISMRNDPAYEDFNIDSAYILEDDLLLLLIQADDETSGEEASSFGEGIILRLLKDELEDTYERIGYATFWRPKMTLFQQWEVRSLKIV